MSICVLMWVVTEIHCVCTDLIFSPLFSPLILVAIQKHTEANTLANASGLSPVRERTNSDGAIDKVI